MHTKWVVSAWCHHFLHLRKKNQEMTTYLPARCLSSTPGKKNAENDNEMGHSLSSSAIEAKQPRITTSWDPSLLLSSAFEGKTKRRWWAFRLVVVFYNWRKKCKKQQWIERAERLVVIFYNWRKKNQGRWRAKIRTHRCHWQLRNKPRNDDNKPSCCFLQLKKMQKTTMNREAHFRLLQLKKK